MQYYGYLDPHAKRWVLSSDDDRFTNHFDSPNTIEGSDRESTIAIHDIRLGDKITWNYRDRADMSVLLPSSIDRDRS